MSRKIPSLLIYCVSSPWHLLQAAAHCRKHNALACVQLQAWGLANLQALNGYAQLLDLPVCSHIDLSAFVPSQIKKRPLTGLISACTSISSMINNMRSFYSLCATEEISICFFTDRSLATYALRLTSQHCGRVNCVRMDDGISDYLPFFYTDRSRLERSLGNALHTTFKFICKLLTGVWREKIRNERRITWFPDCVQKNGNQVVSDMSSYMNAIQEVAKNCYDGFSSEDCSALDEAPNAVVLLGQSLSEDGLLSVEEELDLVSSHVSGLNQMVFYKPHPRDEPGKVQKMLATIPSLHLLRDKGPVEALMANYKQMHYVGFWSNPLIVGRMIWSVKCYSLLHKHSAIKQFSERKIGKIYHAIKDLLPSE